MPASLGLGDYCERYINCTGIPVVGTPGVRDEALEVADETIDFMLSGDRSPKASLLAQGAYYILKGPGVQTEDLPVTFEATGDAEGSASGRLFAATSPSQWILCDTSNETFFGDNTFVHEMVHLMHFGWGVGGASSLGQEIGDTYRAARAEGLWDRTYAATNELEYLAELTQKWLEVGRRAGPPEGDGIANDIVTRQQLMAYDPRAASLISSLVPDGFDVPGCVRNNTVTAYDFSDLARPGSATDADGNMYPVVKIGPQCWMAGT